MMNPNAYGPPPAMQPMQQQQPPHMPPMGGQQQYAPPGWPTQQPGMPAPLAPSSMPGSIPSQQTAPPTQSNINGNYQQQVSDM